MESEIMNDKTKKMSAHECLKHARMLESKFAFEHDDSWHIHWPKDQPTVLHAKTEKELVVALAAWLQKIGRVGNQGEHVEPEYP